MCEPLEIQRSEGVYQSEVADGTRYRLQVFFRRQESLGDR